MTSSIWWLDHCFLHVTVCVGASGSWRIYGATQAVSAICQRHMSVPDFGDMGLRLGAGIFTRCLQDHISRFQYVHYDSHYYSTLIASKGCDAVDGRTSKLITKQQTKGETKREMNDNYELIEGRRGERCKKDK